MGSSGASSGWRSPSPASEGKAKLSQNRSEDDRRGVVAGLLAEEHYEAAEVAAAMEPDL